MLHLIGKNLWARRYRNGWLLAELIIVSMVIWVLTDPIVVTTHDRGLPTGITEEGMYRLNLAAVSSKSARFEAGEDTPEARAANVRRILSRIRDYEDVRYATLQFRDVGPFCSSSWSRSLNTDSLHYYPYMVMFFEPQSQFFSTFGFEEVEGQTNEELDRMPFENKEVVMTVDPVPGVVSLGYRYVDFKTDTLNWIIKATIGKLRMRNGMQPQNVLAEPQQLEKFEIPEEVCIVFRTKPAINETQFMQHFRPWAEKELRVGNLYMRSVKSYHEVIADNQEENSGAFFKKLLLQQLGIIRLVANTPTSQNQALLKLISGIGNKEIPVEGLLAWADLYPVIDKLYDGFYSRMMEKFGQVLSDKEVQICCLLCAGFSTKEIGVVTQQTSATIYVRKTSIRKKINAGEKQDIVECIRGI